MNYFKSITVAALLSFPAFVFSQSKIAEIGKALQEDAKPKQSGQSNLAVSDEGKGGTKGSSHSSSKTSSPPPSSNIAVSDEGKGGSKGSKSSSREAKDSTKPSDLKKAESTTEMPKE